MINPYTGMRIKPIEFKVAENGCFNCISHHHNTDGYHQFTRNGKEVLIHRYIYEQCFGEIPNGKVIMHTCDNRDCINPEHLVMGTQQANVMDMFHKGRGVRTKGEAHHWTVLTEDQVLEIYHSSVSAKDMAIKYGVHISTVNYIRSGKNWTWLTGGEKKCRTADLFASTDKSAKSRTA